MSQKQQILTHLKRYGSITARVAIEKYGCYRLAARIDELRRHYPIETIPIRVRSRSGKRTTIAKYRLIKAEAA
jgi:hypothetical protein